MAGKIPRPFIDELIARVDLVDLIDARVHLKKAGKNFVACCPFHSEKSPSFNVSREKQFYHCFGCGVSGNAISFLMEYEQQTFVEAIETLAEMLGVQVPREAYGGWHKQEPSVLPLYQIQAQAAEFYAFQLHEHPEAARARDYLDSRGLSLDIIQRFQLGYAPPGWRNLPVSWPTDSLLASGLAISHEAGSIYDRFRDRVVFPIRDRRGRVVGFGGRVLGDEKPKYLNSPETPVFKKHLEVYGLHEFLSTRQKSERIVVVEGYMDVIALAQHDIPYAVATLGTATSADHAFMLFRHAKELVFCFDGDNAGRAAAWKALEASLPALREGRSMRFLILPQEHDPDSLVREEGREGFEQRLAQAQPLSDYLFGHLMERLDLNSTEGKAALHNQASPLIGKLPQGVFREMMQSRLAKLTGHASKPPAARSNRPLRQTQAERAKPSNLRVILALLMQNPEFFSEVDAQARAALEEDDKAGSFARQLFAVLDENPAIPSGAIPEHFRGGPEYGQAWKLSGLEIPLPLGNAQTEFTDTLKKYLAQKQESAKAGRLDWLEKKAKAVGMAGLSGAEREEYRQLLSKGG